MTNSPTFGPGFIETRPGSLTDTATWSESGDWCPSPTEMPSTHAVRTVDGYGSWHGAGWDIPPLPPASDSGCIDGFPPFPMAQNHTFLHHRQISRSIPEDMISQPERGAPMPLAISHPGHSMSSTSVPVPVSVSGASWTPVIDTEFMNQHAQAHPQIQNWFAALPNTNPSSPSGFYSIDSPTLSSPSYSHDAISASTAPSSAVASHFDLPTSHYEVASTMSTSAPAYSLAGPFSPNGEWVEKPEMNGIPNWRHATSLSESNISVPVVGPPMGRLNRLRSQTTSQMRRMPSKQKSMTSVGMLSPVPASIPEPRSVAPERSASASVTPKQQERIIFPGTPQHASPPNTSAAFSPWEEKSLASVSEALTAAV